MQVMNTTVKQQLNEKLMDPPMENWFICFLKQISLNPI